MEAKKQDFIKINNPFAKLVCKTINFCFWLLVFVIASTKITRLFFFAGNGCLFIVLFVVCFVLFLLFFGGQLINKLKRICNKINKLSVFQMILIMFSIITCSKLFFVFLFDNDYTVVSNDMNMYWSYANQLAKTGIINYNVDYAYNYQYTVVYGLFLAPIVKIFGSDTKVLTIFLSILYAVTSVLIFDLIRGYIGNVKAFVGILIFNFFPISLFSTQVINHEITLLFFYIFSFWLLEKAYRETRIMLRSVMILFSGLLISFGAKINSGGLVIIISYFIYVAVLIIKDSFSIKRLFRIVCCIITFSLCFLIVSPLCNMFLSSHINTQKLEESSYKQKEYYLPLGWGLYLGTNTEKCGLWNDEDNKTYYQYQKMEKKEDAINYQHNLVNNRLSVFENNPLSIFSHLYKKMMNLWGDDYIWTQYTNSGNKLSRIFNECFDSLFPRMLLYGSYIISLTICLLIVLSYKRKRVIHFNPCIQFKTTIIGITSALILFEVMPKYVSHMQIILFVVLLFYLDDFKDNSIRFRQTIKNKLKKVDAK